MPRYNPLDDVFLTDPEAAIRYLVFRAEHRPEKWTHVRTIDRALTVSLKVMPADEETETPEQLIFAVSHATRQPDAAELYEVQRCLVHHGLIPGARTEHRERRAVSGPLTRAVEASVG